VQKSKRQQRQSESVQQQQWKGTSRQKAKDQQKGVAMEEERTEEVGVSVETIVNECGDEERTAVLLCSISSGAVREEGQWEHSESESE
jgi:hypothetical protein